MSDGFYSDEEPDAGKGSGLPAIVEVPSEDVSSSRATSARSDRTDATGGDDTHRDDSNYDSDEASDRSDGKTEEDTPRSSRPSSRRKKKKKVKNGKFHIDMTPPDKLLRKSDKKCKRYLRDKKADKAIPELIRCTALARIVYGDGHWKLAKAYVDLGEAYLDLKGYAAQAQYHSENARDQMMSGVQLSSDSTDKANILLVLLSIYHTLGRALTQLKKYSEAEQTLTKAEKIATERSKISSVTDDEIDEWDMKIYLAIARLSAKQQKQAMAAEYFDKALDVMIPKYGKDALELIPVYQGLGVVEQSKGKHADHEKAIEHFLQAHSIASKHYKDGSVEVADTAKNLAMAYSKVGQEDAEKEILAQSSAESYLNECLAIYQGTYGPHHEKTLQIQDELARLMIRADRPDEATELLKSTLEAKKEVYGEFSAEVAESWKLMGSVSLSQGEMEKAMRALKKCHNIECMLYGSNNKKSKDTQRTIDILMANPNIAAKQKRSKADELKSRPRFSGIVGRNTELGGFKAQ